MTRLRLAATAGAALAMVGCHQERGAEPVPGVQPQPQPKPNSAPKSGTASQATPPPTQAPEPEPKPTPVALKAYEASALGCYGPEHDDGYFGQCCVDVVCYEPEGNADCMPPKEARAELDDLLPAETGDCSCPVADGRENLEGPYAPGAADEGRCCYLSGSIACEGRAFLMHGVPRVAAVVQRSDWLA